MKSADKIMIQQPDEKQLNHNRKFTVLNHAIASFNNTAQELEQSYGLLNEQIKKLNSEVEEKNRQLEKNLNEKERVKNFLSSILESLPTGVVVVDLKGQLLMCNSAVQKITGDCLAGMDKPMFTKWIKKFHLSGSSDRDLSQTNIHDIEFLKSNSDVRNLKVFQSPVVGTDGNIMGGLFIIQDQTLLKKLETQSERDKRLKAMGEMAIRIAHEVRNPLGSIELFASILRSELDKRDDLQKMAERIITEVKGLDKSISNLLLLTKPQKPLFSEINLSEFLREFVEFIHPVLSKNGVELGFDKAGRSYFISGDRDLLKQVFLNLTLNSMQALPDGGSIGIELSTYNDDNDKNSRWVEIAFCDDGVGIDPESVNKIFHPFYTNKEKGTGLGLAIVHNIVESHGGTIEVRSRLREGTTFLVSLPVLNSNRA